MPGLILGLDLGANSIGWALLDETSQRVVTTGVRVFPEGVDRDQQGGEVSKSVQRRIARSIRRQIKRRSRRKARLRQLLVDSGLLPTVAGFPREHPDRVRWEHEAFQQADPYILRQRALNEKLRLDEIGRVLLHLNQRRGFESNRRADRANKKETSQMLQEISGLAQEMGDKTLGEYLAGLRDENPGKHHLIRLRGMHTNRGMYRQELDRVWSTQQAYYPDRLTDDLKQRVGGIIFYQRPMYWPASVIGHCEIEPRHARSPRADRRAQRFRLLQEVNNLRLLDSSTGQERPLATEERTLLLDHLSKTKDMKFDVIRKKLRFLESVRFNLERGDRKVLKGIPTDHALAHKNLFGKSWHALPGDDRNRLVSALINENEPRIRELAGDLGLNPDKIENLLDISLEDGYMSYCLHAIKKLLPHLEAGLPLTSRDGQASALSESGYILPWEKVPNQQRFLPEPPDLTNPLVRTALHEVRKTVNAIIREHVYRPGHVLKGIHIELAREVRGTAAQRQKRSKQMRQRQAERDAAAGKIREHGFKPTRDTINRYLLWEDQCRVCLYSGDPISIQQLLGGEIDVDHILPYSRSLDDSMLNKVVCFRSENVDKDNRTVHEWLAVTDPRKYEAILQRADRLPDYAKTRRFRQNEVSLDDFFARQFVDTTYITSQVHQYVRCLGADVVCSKGQHTAELRHQWGLNSLIGELEDSPAWNAAKDLRPGEKNRLDHRHHALDAIVIALLNRSRLRKLASIRRFGGTQSTGEAMPEPWPDFRRHVEEQIGQIKVSHRVRRKIKGALHKDTIYGPTPNPKEFVYRKPVESLSPPMVEKIRDPVVRELVKERLQQHGIEPKRGGGKIPTEVWKEPLYMRSKDPTVKIPIRKVRLVTPSESIQPIRANSAYVQPGNTHHLSLFEYTDDRGKTRREAVFVSMLDAIQRVKDKKEILQRTHPTRADAKFLLSLSTNEMVLLNHNGEEDLYRLKTSNSSTQQMIFRHHTAAVRSSDKIGIATKYPNTFEGRKVTVDSIGRVRWAND